MTFDFLIFFESLAGAFLGSGVIATILGIWFKHNLIKREKLREVNIAVTDILTEWVRSNYSSKPFDNDDRWRLQTTYWKNIMWLDKEIIDILFPLLARRDPPVSTNEVLVRARKIIRGLKSCDIKAEELNNWPPEKSKS